MTVLVGARSLVVWMLAAIVAVTGIAIWDAQRESVAALEDFGAEQVTVALAVAPAFAVAMQARAPQHGLREEAANEADAEEALRAADAVEKPGALVVLAAPESAGAGAGARFVGARGPVTSASLAAGVASHARWLRLGHDDAAALGLPPRTAMAGFARADAGPAGAWNVVVVASALRERDREVRAQRRLGLSVSVAAGLVLVFGGAALRRQRKELELERELAVRALEKQRDERLVRADKLATLGALSSGIAHEVSTPLAVILGRAEQLVARLAGDAGDDRSRRAAADIVEQSERIGAIVRGFLALARGEPGALERVSPDSVAKHASALVEHRFAHAQVALTTHVADGLPEIACEPRLFEQALVNLLLNACDACDPGGRVALDVSVHARDEDTGTARASRAVVFEVDDDGHGIPKEAVARVTEPFFTTKPAGKGTGLGLAIANEIVKHHHGTLTLEPGSSRGTRAKIEVPVRDDAG